MKVAVDKGVEDGVVVSSGGVLVAVLVRLDAAFYGGDRGRWRLEAGFGSCDARPPTFATIDAALRWVAECLGLDADSVVPALASLNARS